MFKLIAELMKDNPPEDVHAAQWKPFHYIGIVPGKSFDEDQLSDATRAGLKRAAEMGPQVMSFSRNYPYHTVNCSGISYIQRI